MLQNVTGPIISSPGLLAVENGFEAIYRFESYEKVKRAYTSRRERLEADAIALDCSWVSFHVAGVPLAFRRYELQGCKASGS